MDRYIFKDGKKMRYGYTTGSCATAAAKGAARMLITQNKVEYITIDTLKGWKLDLELEDIVITEEYALCSVKKDAGDDPDITDGIKIFAKVEKTSGKEIDITGGEGIGVVTRKGLAADVGKHAINPTPRKTIEEEVKAEILSDCGVKVTIFSPEGIEIGKKTFNPLLGIEGGISIIGTTGIVEPMSEEAFKDSLAIEISVKKEEGIKKLILSPGNYGRDFSKSIGLDTNYLIKTSNFIGFMLDKMEQYQIEEVLWVGHIGKMVKVAAGIFHTHSRISDARMETLAAYSALLGADTDLTKNIMKSLTTEEAIEYIKKWDKEQELFNLIAQRISDRCNRRLKSSIKVGTIIFSQQHGMLGKCNDADHMMRGFKVEKN